MSKPIYKRILLKLSGEALQGEEGFGIDPSVLDRMASEVKELVAMGVEVGIVLGGGNLFRGAKLAQAGMNRVVGDHMGMLATVMNGLAMRDALHREDVNAKLMSAFDLTGICDNYNWSDAIKMLREGRVVIFSAGTGNPFFTTDSAACLRGIEIEADVVLKATKVDGVYDCDPEKNPNAILFNTLTYAEVIDKELKVMDLAAFTLARDHKIPIRVFNMGKAGALKKVVLSTEEGTTIS
ncbi:MULTISPECIES: UMP kinase [Pasteurellaceae]|uniref:Uridylate kinase n=1 Tax=Pasteurella atlantica TaxID=2827233 RepID=A0AAW8CMX3_9PAST|nr:UMP kinase [Pasteurella atlantica]MBR0574148.1 UMP kinase [Pasteurella atlantica]MDP8040051.1 UMP kinase [Pasteurella atlantica]MDP8042140.1 UMP kinase [Pasteurella atlantica]MDP8044359.1 UMP kinase [Pasteurella atlantica]MDP8046400.1 UMP kinase [Pasteurella atlantica]